MQPRLLADVIRRGPIARVEGAVLGPYVIEREIARGAYGVVFQAWQPNLARRVAIKVLITGADASERHKTRFLREANLAAGLDHPGIVRVYDQGEEAGLLFLVMEFVEGGHTLKDEMEQADGSEDSIRHLVDLVARVAEALEAAHERGVVHRDLKPGNILIRAGGDPVVTDFGLARDLATSSDLTKTGTALGTPAYMSPEQVRGQPTDPATDVYSLGVILYHALTGRIPLWEGNVQAMYAAILTQMPPSPSRESERAPAALDGVVLTAMAKNPARRYPSAGPLGEDLRAWLEGRLAAAPRVPLLPLLLVVVPLLALGLGLALYLRGSGAVEPAGETGPGKSTAEPRPGKTASAPVGLNDNQLVVGPDWMLAHGMSAAQLVERMNAMRRRGYLVGALQANDAESPPRFSAAWTRVKKHRWLYRHGLTGAELSQAVTELKGTHRTSRVVVYRDGDQLRYGCSWVSRVTSPVLFGIYRGMDLAGYRKRIADFDADGYFHSWLSVTRGKNGQPAFSANWLKGGWPELALQELTAKQLELELLKNPRDGYRLHCFDRYGPQDSLYAGIWVRDRKMALTFHRLAAAEHRAVVRLMKGDGLRPSFLFEHPGRPRRYSSTWARSSYAKRVCAASGKAQAGLEMFDKVMERELTRRAISRAALAVTKDGRLVYARGFTYGYDAMTPTPPAARFRIGEVSMLLTSIAVLRLVARNALRLDQTLGELLPEFVALHRKSHDDRRAARITVRHLLQHRVPWDGAAEARREATAQGRHLDHLMAETVGARLPISRNDVVRFAAKRFRLHADPGAKEDPCRFGYLLLAQVIEKISGTPYAEFVRKQVLAPLGLESFALAKTRFSERMPGEVIYESGAVGRSALGDGTVGPFHYGGWHLAGRDAVSGWVASAPDLVRLVSAVSDPDRSSPLLPRRLVEQMLRRGKGRNGYGFGLRIKGSRSDPLAWRQGRMTGTFSVAMRVPGGISLVLLCNRLRRPDGFQSALEQAARAIARWPGHDLFRKK